MSIRLQEPPYNPPTLPDINKQPLTAEEADAYLAAGRREARRGGGENHEAGARRDESMGLEAEADMYSPTLQASLTPDEIRKAQELKGLERIYQAPVFEPMLDVARQVVHGDVMEARGMAGWGVW